MDTGQQGSAKGFELIVIAAVLLGGTSFMGGKGTIIGTILGIADLGFGWFIENTILR